MSGTCIKDTWTKPKGVRSRVGDGDGWWGEMVGRKWRKLYLKKNLKKKKKN